MRAEILKATVEDAARLGYIHSCSWQRAYKNIIPDSVLENITPEKRTDYFWDAISECKEDTYIVILDKNIAGFVTLGNNRDADLDLSYGEIWGIYLAPEFWHKGLGRILINWGIQELKDRNFRNISLWVLEENRRARAFYEKVGFSFDGTSKEINIGKILIECRYTMSLE